MLPGKEWRQWWVCRGNCDGAGRMTAIVTSILRGLPVSPVTQPIRTRRFERIAFVASQSAEARRAQDGLAERYGAVAPEAADCIVALGGDGLMLQILHRHLHDGIPIYGMNRGTVGFLTARACGSCRRSA
jgi:NAD kinase